MVKLTRLERLMFDIASHMDEQDCTIVRFAEGFNAAEQDRASNPAKLLVMMKRKSRTASDFVSRLRRVLLTTSNAEVYREILEEHNVSESSEDQVSFHKQWSFPSESPGTFVSGHNPSPDQKRHFRSILSRVAEKLSKKRLDTIVPIIDVLEPDRNQISSVLGLFDILERTGKIAFDDVDYLEELLCILKEMEAVKLLTMYKSGLQTSDCSFPSQSSLYPSSLPPQTASSVPASSVSSKSVAANQFHHNSVFPTDESLETISGHKRPSSSSGLPTAASQTSTKRPRTEDEEHVVMPSAPMLPVPQLPQDPAQSTLSSQLPSVSCGGGMHSMSVNISVSGASGGLVQQPEDGSAAGEVVIAKPPPYNPYVASETNLSLPGALPQPNQHLSGAFPQQNRPVPSASSLTSSSVSGAFSQQNPYSAAASSTNAPFSESFPYQNQYNPTAPSTNPSLSESYPHQNQYSPAVSSTNPSLSESYPQQNRYGASVLSLTSEPVPGGAFPQLNQSLSSVSSFERARTANSTGEIYTEAHSAVGQEAAATLCIPHVPFMHGSDTPVPVDPQSVSQPIQQASTGEEERARTVYGYFSQPGRPSPLKGQQNVLISKELARLSGPGSSSSYVREGREMISAAALATGFVSHVHGEESRYQNSLNRSSTPSPPQAADDEIRDETSTSNTDGESGDEDPSVLSSGGGGSKEQEKTKESVTETRKKGWLSWFRSGST